jgi:serine/threonine-protein kinase
MVGRTLGRYRIVDELGAGGMGAVYRARDERLNRDVAVKVLAATAFDDEDARARFRREALALSRLNHPNIASIHDFDTQDGLDLLVMELVPGVTLSDKTKAGPLPEKEILALGKQLMQGLAAAHEAGIVHRDLKPGNIRITPDGRLKILDFGLAKELRPSTDDDMTAVATAKGQIVGTLPYMAPEQVEGRETDARTDLWALGCLLYEMVTGQRAFEGATTGSLVGAILAKEPAPLVR